MTAKTINGKEMARKVRADLKEKVNAMCQGKRVPALAVILVGDDPASAVYVRNKVKACADADIRSIMKKLPAETTEAELLSLIDEMNKDPEIDGILVQLPLPKHISETEVIKKISADKDVDGFHLQNVGALSSGLKGFRPCTPVGVMKMLEEIGYDPDGKFALVIGRSNIVGKPMALMLMEKNATVAIAHSHTKNLKDLAKQADIIVAAVGKPKFVTKDMVKPGAIVIDVGMNRDENGKLCGDVDTQGCAEVADWITPVPGGVGPMTIASLLLNTVDSYEKREQDGICPS